MPTTETDLVRAAAARCPDAMTTLYRTHFGPLQQRALAITGCPEDAADAAQDAFVSALRKLGTFRGEARFTTWLHRVAVNACYDVLRRRARQPVLRSVDPDGEAWPDLGPPVADHADDVASGMDAAAALAQVPEEFRVTLVLADVEDLPYEEIARILDVPVGTVKSRVHRGRLALARAMGLSREPRSAAAASEEEP